MARFVLTASNEFWDDPGRWPQPFFDMCEGLSQAARLGLTHPLYSTDGRLRDETILLPDSQATQFVENFRDLDGVVRLRRLA